MSRGEHEAAFLTKEKGQNEILPRKTPSLQADEVLIQITSTAINPVDWKMRDWGIFVPKYPVILGSDAAGRIADVGEGVRSSFKKGDRVWFQGIIGTDDGATFQQFAKMPAELVGHTPDNVSDDEAAGLGLASVCALTGLYDHTGFGISPTPMEPNGATYGKGRSIVVLGGGSSVAQYVVQLARLSGFATVVTGSSLAHRDTLKAFGATHALERKASTNDDYVRAALSDGHSFHMLYDAIGSSETQLQGIDILHKAAHASSSKDAKPILVSVYSFEERVKQAAEAHQVELKVVWGIGSKPELRPLVRSFMQSAGGQQGWLASKEYVPNRPLVIQGGLPALDKALDRNRAGVSGEKVVINPTSA